MSSDPSFSCIEAPKAEREREAAQRMTTLFSQEIQFPVLYLISED